MEYISEYNYFKAMEGGYVGCICKFRNRKPRLP